VGALCVSSCLQTTTHTDTLGVHSRQSVPGPPASNTEPWLQVVMWQSAGTAHAMVSWMSLCSVREYGQMTRQRRIKKQVSVVTVVFAGIVGATALLVFALPDVDPESSVLAGSMLAGGSGLIYFIPKAMEKDTTEPLADRPVWRPAEPTNCQLSPVAYEEVVFEDASGVLRARTDAWGRVTLERAVSTPLTVQVATKPARSVEWR
jgi:hypothetical protein